MIRTELSERDEAVEGGAIVVAQPLGEVAEDLGGHAVAPVGAAHEARAAAQRDQRRHAFGRMHRGMQREHAAQRPADPRRHRQLRVQRVADGIEGQRRGVVAAQVVPGQIDEMQGVAIAQAFDQRREHAAVHRPAVDQDQRRAFAAHRGVQGRAHRCGSVFRAARIIGSSARHCTPMSRANQRLMRRRQRGWRPTASIRSISQASSNPAHSPATDMRLD